MRRPNTINVNEDLCHLCQDPRLSGWVGDGAGNLFGMSSGSGGTLVESSLSEALNHLHQGPRLDATASREYADAIVEWDGPTVSHDQLLAELDRDEAGVTQRVAG